MPVERLSPREVAMRAALDAGMTPLDAMRTAGYQRPSAATAAQLAVAIRRASAADDAEREMPPTTLTVVMPPAPAPEPQATPARATQLDPPTDPATLPAPTSATDSELVAQVEADLRRRDIEPKVRLDLTRWLLDYRRALVTRDTAESYPDPALVAAFLVRRSQPDAQPVPEQYAREVLTQVAALLGVTQA